MRRLPLVLFSLYALTGVAFAVFTLLGRDAPPDDALALPLPEWAMWLAVFVNLAIAAGGFLRVGAVRAFAVALHALVTLAALLVFVLHETGVRPMHGDHPLPESIAKFAVHAALTWYWLRSRALRNHFAGR
ncbi:MAG: hypothetical protein H6835_01440 [Planctomycetes bacterium]|nr:hypothetical protein [Planctomycetota bacterium]